MTPYHLAVTTDPGTPGASAARDRRRVSVEVPTLLLVVAAYGAWLAITFAYGYWPLAILAPVTAVLITLHSSLQHEIVHGHPTRWTGINRLLGMVPLSLWMPFERYRRSHRLHHIDQRITDPLDDPESFYWTPQDRARVMWLEHLLWCVPVILWVKVVCGMPLWIYLLTMVIPANGIVMIRAFAEHRARPQVRERIAIVEESWILGPLFLFNNLHSLHHEAPLIPWYQYPARYRLIRDRLIAENGGLVYRTYFEVARRFLFRPHDAPQHPSGRVPVRPA